MRILDLFCFGTTIIETAATPRRPDSAPANAAAERGPDTSARTPEAEGIDFGVADVMRVITESDSQNDRDAVARDIGRTDSVHDRSPDVTIRFVDEISPTRLRVLDGGWTGYGDDGVYFLDPSTHAPLAMVSQGERWGEARIVCRRGVDRVPFLATALDLAALFHDWAPVHGSAWVTPEGKGVLVAGWAHSGKTGALLSACEGGASPVGDDRILLARSGSRMVGMGRPVGVKDWHMAQLPLAPLGRRPFRRALARAAPALDALSDGARRIPGPRLAAKALERLRRGLEVELPPERLGTPAVDARVDVVIILETHRHASIVAEPVAPGSAARRLAAQTEGELLPALRAQLAFTYALPSGGWKDVGRAPAEARRILEDATRGVPAYLVRHPYPCPLKELDAVIAGVAAEV